MTNQIIKQLFGSKNGVVVRALVFYECCQGLVPAWRHIRFGVLTIWQENLEVSVWSQMVSQFSGNSVQKLWSSFRGTPLFLFETQLWKLPFAKRSSFQSLISQKQLWKIELQMVSAISFCWFADFGKTLAVIQRLFQAVLFGNFTSFGGHVNFPQQWNFYFLM